MTHQKRKLRVVSMILMLTMLLGTYAPIAAVALDVDAWHTQNMWNDVINADLSSEYTYQPDELEYTPTTEELRQEYEASLDEYETDRFIIKYRDDVSRSMVQAQFEAVYEKETPVLDMQMQSSFASKELSGKYDLAVADEYTDIDVYRASEVMTTSEMLSDIRAHNLDRYIEYIQPDYEMNVSELDISELQQFIDTESLEATESETTPTDSEFTDTESVETEAADTETVDTSDLLDADTQTIETEIELIKLPDTLELVSTPVIVALLDTGIDDTHPDLAGHLIGGYDFVNDDSTVNDLEWYYDQGHATMIAGIIAEASPEAVIMPLKVFQGGVAYTSDIIRAIEYAEAAGAKIANCSWGSRYENRALREAMESSGMLFVCAAGNNLYSIDKYPVYPASFGLANIISVSSVGADDRLSRFSNYGVNSVDVTATGSEIGTTWLDHGYNKGTGTSMSAGVVSGLAASLMVKYDRQGTIYTSRSVKARIMESSDTVTGLLDKVRHGKRVNGDYALSDIPYANPAVIDVPDDEAIPDVTPYGDVTEEYEEYGAQDYIDIMADMPTPSYGLCTVSLGGKIYAIGGIVSIVLLKNSELPNNSVSCYDPVTNKWASVASMKYARAYFGAVVYGGKIYVFGGESIDASNARVLLSSVECYDPVTNTWTVLSGGMPTRVSDFTATLNPSTGKVYVIGGSSSQSAKDLIPKNTVYEYTISTNTWANLLRKVNRKTKK